MFYLENSLHRWGRLYKAWMHYPLYRTGWIVEPVHTEVATCLLAGTDLKSFSNWQVFLIPDTNLITSQLKNKTI